MNKGMNEWSWKYSSILSFSVSRDVDENKYGPRSLLMALKGVMIAYFSFIFTLENRMIVSAELCSHVKVSSKPTVPSLRQSPWSYLTVSTSITCSVLAVYQIGHHSLARQWHSRESSSFPYTNEVGQTWDKSFKVSGSLKSDRQQPRANSAGFGSTQR